MSAAVPQLAVDVRMLLARPLSELRGFTDPVGRPMSPRQVRAALVAELASGNELLPVGRSHQFNFIQK
jgi:hypothetical protein